MYMGLELEPGYHEIELRYCTPGIVPGAAVTLGCGVIYVVLLVIWIRKRRNRTAKLLYKQMHF